MIWDTSIVKHHQVSQFLGQMMRPYRCWHVAEDLKEDHHGASESHGRARIIAEGN